MKFPERTLTIQLSEREHTLEYPKTRGLINISIQKANLSRQRYDAIASSISADDTYSRYLIDMVATFRVLLPNLEKELNVESFLDLDPIDASKFLKVYLKKVYPWMVSWQTALTADPDETENKDETEE